METRPTQFSYVCNATRIEPGNSICISPVFDNSESPLQNSRVVRTVILITPAWQTEPWYPKLHAMSFSQPFLPQMSSGVLKNPKGEDHPLVINKSLALVAWKFTGKPLLS